MEILKPQSDTALKWLESNANAMALQKTVVISCLLLHSVCCRTSFWLNTWKKPGLTRHAVGKGYNNTLLIAFSDNYRCYLILCWNCTTGHFFKAVWWVNPNKMILPTDLIFFEEPRYRWVKVPSSLLYKKSSLYL